MSCYLVGKSRKQRTMLLLLPSGAGAESCVEARRTKLSLLRMSQRDVGARWSLSRLRLFLPRIRSRHRSPARIRIEKNRVLRQRRLRSRSLAESILSQKTRWTSVRSANVVPDGKKQSAVEAVTVDAALAVLVGRFHLSMYTVLLAEMMTAIPSKMPRVCARSTA